MNIVTVSQTVTLTPQLFSGQFGLKSTFCIHFEFTLGHFEPEFGYVGSMLSAFWVQIGPNCWSIFVRRWHRHDATFDNHTRLQRLDQDFGNWWRFVDVGDIFWMLVPNFLVINLKSWWMLVIQMAKTVTNVKLSTTHFVSNIHDGWSIANIDVTYIGLLYVCWKFLIWELECSERSWGKWKIVQLFNISLVSNIKLSNVSRFPIQLSNCIFEIFFW